MLLQDALPAGRGVPLSNRLHELPSEGLNSLQSNNMSEALLGPGSLGGRNGYHFQEPAESSPEPPQHRRFGSHVSPGKLFPALQPLG